jgi:pimeloyl-ACP methyl ester carboxylesterase
MELFAKAHPDEVAGLVLVDTRHRDFTTACQDAGLGAECSVPASTVDSLSDVERDEYRAFANASAEIHDAGNFGAYPVRVLTATSHHFSTKAEALWVSIQSSLANEAPDGKQICYPGAGHLLQVDKPHEVASVILSLVPAAKN